MVPIQQLGTQFNGGWIAVGCSEKPDGLIQDGSVGWFR